MPGRFDRALGVDGTEHGRLRAEDVATRERAAELLAAAAASLRAAAAAYQRTRLPAPSREQPFPTAESLRPPRAAEQLAGTLAEVASAIRAAPFPEPEMLAARATPTSGWQLLDLDQTLLQAATGLTETLGEPTPADLDELDPEPTERGLHRLRALLTRRAAQLAI